VPVPTDVVTAKEFKADAAATVKPVGAVAADDLILDIGPETAAALAAMLKSAGTIVWNGPVGVFEFDAFSAGTETLARAIAASKAFSIAGWRRHARGDRQVRHREGHRLHLDRRRRVPRGARGQDAAGDRDPGTPRLTNPGKLMDTSTPRATKIVATLGPASSSAEVLERMLRAGVDVVRLNFSHGTAQDHIDRATLVREVAKAVGKEVAIMADLQGPKIRVGKIENGKTTIVAGEKLVLDAAYSGLGNSERVGLDYKELPRDVRPGDTLLINDGLLRLVVDAVRGEEVHTRIVVGGELSNNKGINKAGGGLTAPALTAKDMEDIKTAMSFQCEYLAVSFRRAPPTWRWRASSPTSPASSGGTSRS
jgi:hypothetical protein